MKYPKLREIKEALRSLFTKSDTTKFPYEPHIPFLSFRGRPYFHQDDCVGCAACVTVCPTGALSFADCKEGAGYKRIFKVRWDICIECGQCELNCLSEKGIQLSNEFDMSTTQKRKELYQVIEKEMALCEACARPVACVDHVRWTIQKLGPLYVSNTSLIALSHQVLGVRDTFKHTQELFRWDRFRVLCPQCRRKAVVTS